MRPTNVHVERRQDEPVDVMLRRFTKLMKKNEILDEVRERMFFVKPSKIRHDKKNHVKHIFKMQRLQRQEEEANRNR